MMCCGACVIVGIESEAEKEDGRDDDSPEGALIEILPPAEPERLHNAQLALVVAQVQFPAILSIQADQALLARFQDRIRNKYPYLFLGQQFGFNIGPQGVEQPQQASSRLYQFADAEREWMVTLTANSIALETRDYTDYEDFSERLLRILASAQDVYKIPNRQRLGLRYVNEIRHPNANSPEDWTSLINPQLLGILANRDLSPLIASSFQETSIRLDNGRLTLRHGHFAQGTTVAPSPGEPPKDGGPFYLLDLDAYDEEVTDLDAHTLDGLLESYNNTMFQLLRWGVQEELFKYLKDDE
jgi:uncharacterized protein (TIGR04255 family)